MAAGHAGRSGATLDWRCTAFESLTPRELQNIYAARQRVFIVEQSCPFLDADGFDEGARHLAAWASAIAEPLAYARLLAPGSKYAEASIGRVLTSDRARGQGLGRDLMVRALSHVAALWPDAPVRISAQSRLERFYGSFGFRAAGERYLEDGIWHTEMLLVAPGHADNEPRG